MIGVASRRGWRDLARAPRTAAPALLVRCTWRLETCQLALPSHRSSTYHDKSIDACATRQVVSSGVSLVVNCLMLSHMRSLMPRPRCGPGELEKSPLDPFREVTGHLAGVRHHWTQDKGNGQRHASQGRNQKEYIISTVLRRIFAVLSFLPCALILRQEHLLCFSLVWFLLQPTAAPVFRHPTPRASSPYIIRPNI